MSIEFETDTDGYTFRDTPVNGPEPKMAGFFKKFGLSSEAASVALMLTPIFFFVSTAVLLVWYF